MKIARLIGGAGTGKTTELQRIMEGALPKLGNDPLRLGFASFTRAARAEAVARVSAAWNVSPGLLDHDGWFRTVHSTCKRCLGIQPGQLIGDKKDDIEWISNALGVRLSTSLDEEVGRQKFIGDPVVAAALNCWSLAKNCLLPLEQVVRRMRAIDDDVPDFAAIVRVAERYEMAKRVRDRLDFTDLLMRFAGLAASTTEGVYRVEPQGDLPPVDAWLFDEQQDASPLLDAACKRLVSAPSVKWCYVVGDPFQCQPEGTPVLTADGYKPIESLDPEQDRLIAYNRKDGRFYGTGGGTRFQKASRMVDSGSLVEVTFTDGTKSTCTTNHRWLVRTNRGNVYATYLMRKGERWRIGTVQMFANGSEATAAKNGEFRLKMRMNQEAADDAWVLRTFDTDREARLYEQVASFKYGIPQVTFRPPHGKTYMDREFIDAVFEGLGDLSENADRCLSEHGLNAMFPFCSKADRSKNGNKACRFVYAANLLPGIHVAPKLLDGYFDRAKRGSGDRRGARGVGKSVEFIGVASVRRLPAGRAVRVYSLEVERHHTYVTTNGIVTGNSIYGFAGSHADCFLGWQADKERSMPKSYRCPKPILELGERCLRRMTTGYFDRGIAPADHAGSVSEADDLDAVVANVDPNDDWLFIARTNYHAGRMHAALAASGRPARWVKSPEGPTARSEGLKALFALERDQHVTGVQWGKAIALLPPQDKDKQAILARGVKTRWASQNADKWDCIFASDLSQVGAQPALIEAIRSGAWCRLVDRGDQWRQQATKWGADLAAEPRIRVGTIHCSPPDEPVFTTDGYVPIGELDQRKHFLCAFDRKGVRFVWGRRGRGTGSYVGVGYAFKKCWRPYEGTLLTLTTDRSKTRVTPEHRVTVRYAETFFNKHIVYLMRRNNCWRIGIATSAYRRPYVSGGLNGRLATEDADAGWILSVHETREEALFHEAVVQAKYGISGMRFRATGSVSTLSSERLMEAHELASPFVSSRVAALMADYGLVFDMPLYKRDGKVRSDRSFDTAAGNVLPGYMELATVRDEFLASRCARDSRDAVPIWLPCKKTAEQYSGPVFSLDVAPHHHYISGGAAVHNSVKGAEADNVVLLTTIGARVEQGMESPEQADEEHRIAYVAVTRTRRNLFVVNEGKHGRQVPRMEVL